MHHPYDSFANSVEAFVEQAASDDSVLAIKQALYRTGGDEAGIVASLVKAAEAGKQVVALVELKARFDEQANIERARMLEQAGAHVVYGLVGLKTHAKVLLVVRQEADGIRRYCHFGTGNYNPKTATTYEDLGVLSSDPDLGSDLSELFNHLTGYSRPGEYRRLLVAPMHLRDELRDLIRGQARPDGEITMKINALVDSGDDRRAVRGVATRARGSTSSCAASAACAPGVPGLSENITVRSIVGRYLEHSRIIRFGHAGDRRHRVRHRLGRPHAPQPRPARRSDAAHHRPAHARAASTRSSSINFADDVLAWTLERDGTWHKVETVGRHRVAGAVPGAGGGAGQGPLARQPDGMSERRDHASPRSCGARSRSRTSASSRTSRICASATIPSRCTRRASRPAGSAPIWRPSSSSSTRSGPPTCAPTCAGSVPSSGAVRDIEVQRDRLRAHAGRLPPRRSRRGAARRSAASTPTAPRRRSDLLAMLREPRYAQVRAKLAAAAAQPAVHRRRARPRPSAR